MSTETSSVLWFLFPILLIVCTVVAWVAWVCHGVIKLRKEQAADEARAEGNRLERILLEAQVQYVRALAASQPSPTVAPGQAA